MTNRQLKAAVTRARSGRKRMRISGELKAEVERYSRERREAGASWTSIGQELGLNGRQVRLVCRDRGASRGRSRLHRVTVIGAAPAAWSAITLTLASGEVVRGLDVGSLAALLKALR